LDPVSLRYLPVGQIAFLSILLFFILPGFCPAPGNT